MAGTFAGKVALVTGAGAGIGRATALAFAREGAQVVVADVNAALGEEVVGELRRAGGAAVFSRCDVSRVDEVDGLVAGTVKAFGRLDVAFNNAGIEGRSAELAQLDVDDWSRVLAVNLTGVMLCMRAELRQMLAQGTGGSIVNNASILGVVGTPSAAAYTAAKHGVLGLTRVAALEYASRKIRVNAVCPGYVKTPMLERAKITTDPKTLAYAEALHPVHRLAEPEEIASAVLWLASEGASFVTGHPLLVDGGYVAQ